ncbi:DUF3561 family protein [Pectobacteriaceae bacterium CE90]|nr:DUF3561 family protein [Prodigiosinella sp. LS101]WJV56130.1 DUF3561 family protein [Prodigiosinella sp. LS101]WJV60497.1 DUF3561 family protein [Pectobacteriaceae bacterium C111]WJY17154.1 DUF3561 family protein [Pectobacteriaceae bacterium CE90]
MQNVTPLLGSEASHRRDEDTQVSYPFMGAIAGFSFYWLAFVLPFLVYGLNVTLFLMLYTWPFFLALMPLSVLIGVAYSILWQENTTLMILCSGITTVSLFWLVFALLTGWW